MNEKEVAQALGKVGESIIALGSALDKNFQGSSQQPNSTHTQTYGSSDCPNCGGKMVLRHRKADGAPFWGCSTFPVCKSIVDYSSMPETSEDSTTGDPEDDDYGDDIPF